MSHHNHESDITLVTRSRRKLPQVVQTWIKGVLERGVQHQERQRQRVQLLPEYQKQVRIKSQIVAIVREQAGWTTSEATELAALLVAALPNTLRLQDLERRLANQDVKQGTSVLETIRHLVFTNLYMMPQQSSER